MHDVSQFICTAYLLLSVVLLLDPPFFPLNYCSKQEECVPNGANRMLFSIAWCMGLYCIDLFSHIGNTGICTAG